MLQQIGSHFIKTYFLQILFSMFSAIHLLTMSVPHMEAFGLARGAATSIFKLIDREPSIDCLDEKGKVPEEEAKGEIIFEDVSFSYPSRPDTKVNLNIFNKKVDMMARWD